MGREVMLEWHWFANRDPEPMLRFLGSQPVENETDCDRGLGRKLRLFIFGCCHRVNHLTGHGVQKSLAVFERRLEEAVADEELRIASQVVLKARRDANEAPGGEYPATCAVGCAGATGPLRDVVIGAVTAAKEAQTAAAMAAEGKHYRLRESATALFRAAGSSERSYQVALLHDIVGNPFRPIPLDRAWRTSDVMLLANGSYVSQDFGAMPILADALQEAGCDSDDVLTHLRDPHATHVRGCWALDLVLGKE
jgi:hypothetical protein